MARNRRKPRKPTQQSSDTQRGGGKRQHSPAKKAKKHPRIEVGNITVKEQIVHPKLQDLQDVIEKSVLFRGCDSKKIPLSVFLFEWKKLGYGWLRLLIPGCQPGKSLTEYEIRIAGLTSSILVGHGFPMKELAFSFGCNRRTIVDGCRNFRQFIFASPLEVDQIETKLKKKTNSPSSVSDSTVSGSEPDLLDELSESKVTLFSDSGPLYLTPIKKKQNHTPSTISTTSSSNTPETISNIGGALMINLVASAKKTKASIIRHTKQALGFSTEANELSESQKIQEGKRQYDTSTSDQTSDQVPTCELAYVPSDKQLKKQAIDLLREKMVSPNNTMDSEVASLVVAFLDETKRHGSDPVAITFSYRVKSGYRTNQKMYIEVTKPRATKETASSDSKLHYIREKGKSVMGYVKKICGIENKEIHAAVIQRLLEGYFGATVASRDTTLSVLDVIAIRELGGGKISTNQIYKVLSGVKKLGNFGNNFMPTRLKKKIGEEERKLQKVEYIQLELNTSKDKKGSCVFYYISGMPLLVERLVSSAILDGTQEESNIFSNYKNKHIFFCGIDKAQDLIAMIRYGNRVNGNTGYNSIPFAVAEDAAEDDFNLRKTLCSPDRVAFIQSMMDRKLHLFQLCFTHDINKTTKMLDAKCICVEFVLEDDSTFHPSDLDCHIFEALEDVVLENASSETIDSRLGPSYLVEDRHLAAKLKLQARMLRKCNGKFELCLKLRMVRHKTTGGRDTDDCYIGCEFYGLVDGRPSKIDSFRFNESVLHSPSRRLMVDANCNPIICIPAQDGKMATTQGGQSTCGVKYPCLRCLRPLECAKYPKWMKEQFPEELPAGAEIGSYPLREGSNSPIECFKHFEALVGTNKAYTMAEKDVSIAIRDACSSITKQPMYNTPLDCISGDPLHLSQGGMTHLTEETVKLLRDILSGDGWAIKKKKEYIQELNELVLELPKTGSYYAAKRHHSNWKSQRLNLVKQIEMAKANEEEDGTLMELQNRLQEMDEAQELDLQAKNYGIMNRKIRGAKIFLSILKGGDKKKVELDEAEFIFLQSIQRYAGSFNKQHGSMELTNARGMKALEKRNDIHRNVCTAYSDTNPDANVKVKEVMDWWLMMADDWFEIGKILKSQQKMTPDRIYKLKKHVVQYGVRWRQKITWKAPVFWKMHVLECCLINFVEKTGMSGRASSEGFENKHYVMGAIKAQLAPMVGTYDRVNKLSQRQQLPLLPGLHERVVKIQEQMKAPGARGPYAKRAPIWNEEEVVILEDNDDEAPDGYFSFDDGEALLANRYAEYFAFYKRSQVPEKWNSGLCLDEKLGNKAVHESKYLK